MKAILDALDMLGLALAEHGHVWTPEERAAYEKAVKIASAPVRIEAGAPVYDPRCSRPGTILPKITRLAASDLSDVIPAFGAF